MSQDTGQATCYRRKVPLAEIYPSISTAFRGAWLDEIESYGVGVTPAFVGLEVGGVAALPTPHSLNLGS